MKKIIFIFLLFLSACTSKPAYRAGFKLVDYQKIGITSFVSNNSVSQSGQAVSDEFIRQLIKRGKKVVEISEQLNPYGTDISRVAQRYGVDALITGTVTKYISDGEETVYFQDAEGNLLSQVFFESAEIGISAKMIETSSAEVLWSDTYEYSGFKIDDTLSAAVSVIVDRLVKSR